MKRSPQGMYHFYEPNVDLNCGYIYVTFMEEDVNYGAQVRDGTTGNEHLNEELAVGVGGAATNVGLFKDVLTKVVQTFTAHFQFVHCEVAFELSESGKQAFGPDKLLASYVNTGENVGLKLRHFNDKYRWFYLRATPEQISSMLKLACLTVGQKFSAELRNNAVTMPGNENNYGWYCSKHVATLLRTLDCEMFHLNRTNTITVDELYHMVENCNHFAAQHLRRLPPVVKESMFGAESVREIIYNKENK